MATATLLVSCPDRRGLVANLAGFISERGGNILHADHHIDLSSGLFLMRVEWDLADFAIGKEEIPIAVAPLAESMYASWELHFSENTPRMAIWVSKQDHCLLDLLWRVRARDLNATVPLIISNHADLEPVARQEGIPYHWLPVSAENRAEREAHQRELLSEFRIDVVVLARYMQILSADMLDRLPCRVINIHHSFLPAFPGAQPYHRAYERGVKIVGATAHYVTPEVDEGPIIDQDIVRISHRDTVPDLIRKGKDLERIVLARAVRYHLENRVLVYGNRTVVFA